MAETVSFPSNGSTASGHLASPPGGSGPGVIVVQEWWGLDPWIKQVTERLASAGFVALAPDLYRGEFVERTFGVPAGHTEMDKAAELMQKMPFDRAARDMSGAVDYLARHSSVTGDGIGVVGFCMGGMLAMTLAANRGDKIKAVVAFYGFPSGDGEPDWSGLRASVRGHVVEGDSFFDPSAGTALAKKLQGMGKDVDFVVHEGVGHAFMASHNSLGTYDEKLAEELWQQTSDFLHEKLG